MRILIDAASVLLRSAGIKTYTYHWIRSLRRLAGGDEIKAFPFLGDFGRLRHESSTLSPWSTYPRVALLYFANLHGNPVIDWIASSADVFHLSNQIRNPPTKVPVTATVHDLTCWLMPEMHTAANVRADRAFADQVVRRARRLIAVSQNTRQDAIRILGIDPEKIAVIYPGVPEEFFDAKPTPSGKPYVLFVSTIEPRKNLDVLLDAWHLLRNDLRAQFDLVIAGPSGWNSERVLARLRAGVEGIKYLGYVAEQDLPGLTAGAAAFVYPSLYEGFGLPVVQAMASKVPVVTSNTSCLPEVAGEGALLADPRSPAELAAQIERLLESAGLRARLGAAGRIRAERFRWEECARRSLEFFRSIK